MTYRANLFSEWDLSSTFERMRKACSNIEFWALNIFASRPFRNIRERGRPVRPIVEFISGALRLILTPSAH